MLPKIGGESVTRLMGNALCLQPASHPRKEDVSGSSKPVPSSGYSGNKNSALLTAPHDRIAIMSR